jgi:hypothetical protein
VKQPRPYPIYSDSLNEDGHWLYVMEEASIDQVELERRARVMRASPLLLAVLKRMVALGEKTWEQPKGSPTRTALRHARKAIDIAENGTEEDRKFEQAGDTQILILPPGETE